MLEQSLDTFPLDTSSIKAITYSNGFKVLLVSDPNVKQAKGTMLISVGCSNDPNDYLGLAHFLEHMVFIKSEKYPEVDHFMSYVGRNDGHTNAYTASDRTCFYFTIAAQNYVPALDIFAEFFHNPFLFDESFVSREVNAVHSEYVNSKSEDYWLTQYLLQKHMRGDVDYSKFGMGCLETLGGKEGIMEALKDFHSKHYTPNKMTLVLCSNQSVDEIQKLANIKFSSIINSSLNSSSENCNSDRNYNDNKTIKKEKKKEEKNTNVFTNLKEEKIVHNLQNFDLEITKHSLLSKKDKLEVFFSIDSILPYYKSNPNFVICRFMNSKIEHTLYDVLKKLEYITDLHFYEYEENLDLSILHLSIDLTKLGLSKIEHIIVLVFKWLNILNSTSEENLMEFYNETKYKYDLNWCYKEPANNAEQMIKYANILHDISDVNNSNIDNTNNKELRLNSLFRISEIDVEALKLFVRQMSDLNRIKIFVGSENYKEQLTNKTEKYYDKHYIKQCIAINNINEEMKANIDSLTFPKENIYIKKEEIDKKINSGSNIKNDNKFVPLAQIPVLEDSLYFTNDTNFSIDKNYIFINWVSSFHNLNISNFIYTTIMLEIINNKLIPILEHPKECLYKSELHSNQRGVCLNISGLNTGFRDIVLLILNEIQNLDFKTVKDTKIETERRKLMSSLIANDEKQPFKMARNIISTILNQNNYFYTEYLAVLKADNFIQMFKEHIQTLKDKILNKSYVNVYTHGNIPQSEQFNLQKDVIDMFGGNKVVQKEAFPTLMLIQNKEKNKGEENRKPFCAKLASSNENAKNNLVCIVKQIHNQTLTHIQIEVMSCLLANLLADEFFAKLRTEKQLGYAVFIRNWELNNINTLIFLVQSPNTSVNDVRREIDNFIENTAMEIVEGLKEDVLESTKEALVSTWNEPIMKMKEAAVRNWNEIYSDRFSFQKEIKLIEYCKSVTKEDVKNWYSDYIKESGEMNRTLVVEVNKEMKDDKEQLEKRFEGLFKTKEVIKEMNK